MGGAVRRIEVAITSYEGPSKQSESVEARYPDILLSDLISAIATSRKSGKTEKPVLEFRCCKEHGGAVIGAGLSLLALARSRSA